MNYLRAFTQGFRSLLNPIFPKCCFGCTSLLVPGETVLCTFCRHELPCSHYNFKIENQMDRALYGQVNFKKASTLFFYSKTGILKNCLQHLKYRKQAQVSVFFGKWHGAVLKNDPSLPALDVIVPIPLHPKKRKSRGFNQLSGYGKALSNALGVPFKENAAIKTANTKTQTKKSRTLRVKEQKDLFILKNPKSFEGKNILIIDDVMTTGATLVQFSKIFNPCQGAQRYFLTMAFVA